MDRIIPPINFFLLLFPFSPQVLDFISNCFRIAYLYFGTIQTTLGPILTKIIVPPREHHNNKSKDNNNKNKNKKEEEEIRENKDSPSEAYQETAQAQIQGVAHILNQLKIENETAANAVSSPPPAKVSQNLKKMQFQFTMGQKI